MATASATVSTKMSSGPQAQPPPRASVSLSQKTVSSSGNKPSTAYGFAGNVVAITFNGRVMLILDDPEVQRDFDSTMGYPGEGQEFDSDWLFDSTLGFPGEGHAQRLQRPPPKQQWRMERTQREAVVTVCWHWSHKGECKFGNTCFNRASHTPANRGQTGRDSESISVDAPSDSLPRRMRGKLVPLKRRDEADKEEDAENPPEVYPVLPFHMDKQQTEWFHTTFGTKWQLSANHHSRALWFNMRFALCHKQPDLTVIDPVYDVPADIKLPCLMHNPPPEGATHALHRAYSVAGHPMSTFTSEFATAFYVNSYFRPPPHWSVRTTYLNAFVIYEERKLDPAITVHDEVVDRLREREVKELKDAAGPFKELVKLAAGALGTRDFADEKEIDALYRRLVEKDKKLDGHLTPDRITEALRQGVEQALKDREHRLVTFSKYTKAPATQWQNIVELVREFFRGYGPTETVWQNFLRRSRAPCVYSHPFPTLRGYSYSILRAPIVEESMKCLGSSMLYGIYACLGLEPSFVGCAVIRGLMFSVHETRVYLNLNSKHCGRKLTARDVINILWTRKEPFLAHILIPVVATKILSWLPLKIQIAAYPIVCILMHMCWNVYAIHNMSAEDRKAMPARTAALPYPEVDKEDPYTNTVADVCLQSHGIKLPVMQDEAKLTPFNDEVCHAKHGATASFSVHGYYASVYRACQCNARVALASRVLKKIPAHACKPQVKARWAAAQLAHAEYICKGLGSLKRLDEDDWIRTFVPTKRDLLFRLRKECIFDPPHESIDSGFVKKEICPKPQFDGTYKDPRWIRGCPPHLTLLAGRDVRSASKALARRFSPKTAEDIKAGRQVFYTCGLNANTAGDALATAIRLVQETDPSGRIVFLEDDQSRFDLHLTEGPFKYLDAVYKCLSRRARRYLRRKITRGRTPFGANYSLPYTMQSGWPDTSLGDTLVNLAMKYEIHGRGRNWVSIICGDDSVTITTATEMERLGSMTDLAAKYAEFGMEVECILRESVWDVGFCSGRFMQVGESYVLMPKPGRMFAKLGWDMQERTPIQRHAWNRGIAATLDCFGQIDPLYKALSKRLREVSNLTTRAMRIHESNPYKLTVANPTRSADAVEIAVYYGHHYNLGLADLADLTSYIATADLSKPLNHPVLLTIVEMDV